MKKKRAVKKKVKKFKCPKCGHTQFDEGVIKAGQLFAGHTVGYRSNKHNPYAEHVVLHSALVCLNCGYTEIYFDVESLKTKLKHH